MGQDGWPAAGWAGCNAVAKLEMDRVGSRRVDSRSRSSQVRQWRKRASPSRPDRTNVSVLPYVVQRSSVEEKRCLNQRTESSQYCTAAVQHSER
jgi:hypothetical protein